MWRKSTWANGDGRRRNDDALQYKTLQYMHKRKHKSNGTIFLQSAHIESYIYRKYISLVHLFKV